MSITWRPTITDLRRGARWSWLFLILLFQVALIGCRYILALLGAMGEVAKPGREGSLEGNLFNQPKFDPNNFSDVYSYDSEWRAMSSGRYLEWQAMQSSDQDEDEGAY